MNRTCKALSAAGLLLLSFACTDPTVEPSSTATEVNIFKDQGSYRAFLAKIYAGLATTGQVGPAGDRDIFSITDEGFSQYLRLYWELQELPTDEAVIAWGDQGLPELNTQVWGSSNRFVAGMYSRIYFQVGMANEFLRQTTDAKLSERGVPSALRADIQTFRAEARFLRALSYWHGLDLIGNIPLVTEADPLGASPPHQATRLEVYNFIVNELNAVRPSLPAAGAGTYGRATDAAASMLLAHVYMNAEVYTGTPDYANASAAAQAAIAGPFSLDPSYQHVFGADNNTSPEMIFPVIQDNARTQSYGGTTFLTHASCGNQMNAATYGIDGCWWGIRLKPEAYNRYAAGDTRSAPFVTANQTVAIANISDFSNGVAAPKYSNTIGGAPNAPVPGADPRFADIDYPMFRLADAYLIYAEAFLRGGGGTQAQALTYVNQIRERAYGDTSGDITAAELTLDFILDERGRELLWEGHRRADLLRYDRFTGPTVWSWKGGTLAGGATDAHLDLYPVPASELSANPNLTQNPGY